MAPEDSPPNPHSPAPPAVPVTPAPPEAPRPPAQAGQTPATSGAGPASELTLRYRAAMDALAAGDLGNAVPTLLDIQEKNPETEEAFFSEEHLARVHRLWPAEAEKAGLTAEAWAALQQRAAARRAGKIPEGQDFVPIVVLVAAAAWCFLLAVAPNAALLGRGPDVPLLFRLVAVVVGSVSAADAFGLMKRKWEAVNVFIVLAPVFMIVTFIGLTESPDLVTRAACVIALAGEAYAAWYMSRNSNRFVY